MSATQASNFLDTSDSEHEAKPQLETLSSNPKMELKSLKRRNFKQLSLMSTKPSTSHKSLNLPRHADGEESEDVSSAASSQFSPSPLKQANSSSSSSLQEPRKPSTVQIPRGTSKNNKLTISTGNGLESCDSETNLVSQFASLELGVEFKLDLRGEELQTLANLGHGNGGSVSRVLHCPTGTVLAKKVIPIEAKPAVRKQIIRELHIMHECNSKYIVSYYGAFVQETDIVMCMEYMDCGSLDRICKTFGPIQERHIRQITRSVVQGLDYLYTQHRIIHRDVKPSNVLVNTKGEIKLCDFGVSGELINSIAETFVGTSTYMSPERIQGAAYSAKSDVWSLGITVLELALGVFPFDYESKSNAQPIGILDLLQRIVNEKPPSLPPDGDFTHEFRSFVNCCLLGEHDRPTPQLLLTDPFIANAEADSQSLVEWASLFKMS